MGPIRDVKIAVKIARGLVAIRRRIDAVTKTGDPSSVLDPEALTIVANLLKVPGATKRAEVLAGVAALHWVRYKEGGADADLRVAAEMARKAYDIKSDAVPRQLQHLLDEAITPRDVPHQGYVVMTETYASPTQGTDREVVLSAPDFSEVEVDSRPLESRSRAHLDRASAEDRIAIRLITADTLHSWSRFTRFQDLEPDEYTPWRGLAGRPLVCVSHRWITPGHPDPDGLQLRELQRRLRALAGDDPTFAACLVFYDYASMPQQPRTSAEAALFHRDMGHLAPLFAAADRVIILSEGYADYRERAWCYFECVVAYTATLNYSDGPASNIHFFADQAAIGSDLAFLGRSGFQRIFGQQVQFRSPRSARYQYNPLEAEVLCGIFDHMSSCRTTEPEDKALVTSQLVAAMSQRGNITPYGRLIIALNKYFETSFHVLTAGNTNLLLKPHIDRPDWPRMPAYYVDKWSDEIPDSVFSLSPQDLDTLHADGGLACMLIGLVHPDRRDMGEYIGSVTRRGLRRELVVPAAVAGFPSEDPFVSLERVVETMLHLTEVVLPLPDSPYRLYFPLLD